MPALPTIKTVLLIDDDEDDFMVFEDALKEIDASLVVSYIGSAKDFEAKKDCEAPDIIFLDINMPDKDGFEWLQQIRSSGYAVPVIMYSTASNPAYVQRAYEQGANIYFPKPESFKKLQDSLRELLSYNWQQPQKITEQFYQDGAYKVFCS